MIATSLHVRRGELSPRRLGLCKAVGAALIVVAALSAPAGAQERLPWMSGSGDDAYRPNGDGGSYREPGGNPGNGSSSGGGYDNAYRPPASPGYGSSYRPSGQSAGGDGYYDDRYRTGEAAPPPPPPPYVDQYRRGEASPSYDRRYDAPSGPGETYAPPRAAANEAYDRDYGARPPYRDEMPRHHDEHRRSYSQSEIVSAGHRFFGSVSSGLASVIEYAFKKSGRPNGYILGEDAGGAFVAGLRYGEGVLYTKDAGSHKIYWQGPSVGYDFGAEGSKTMVLVYNLRHPSDIYNRFGGVQGSAYIVGGVSIQFQKYGDIVLAPIRSGVGLRLGANVGYLKYTRRPTWNPF
jgi:hypothetical protein